MAKQTLADLTESIADTNKRLGEVVDQLVLMRVNERDNRAEDKLKDKASEEGEQSADDRQDEMLAAILRTQRANAMSEANPAGAELAQRAGVLSMLFGQNGAAFLFAGDAMIVAVGALALAFTAVQDDADEETKQLNKLSHGFFAGWNSFKVFLKLTPIMGFFKGARDAVTGFFGGLIDLFRGAAGRVARMFEGSFVGKLFRVVGDLAKGIIGGLGDIIRKFIGMSAAWLGVVTRLGRLLKAVPIIGWVMLLVDFLIGFVKSLLDGNGVVRAIVDGFSALWTGIVLAVSGLFELAGMSLNWILRQFGQNALGEKVQEFFQMVANGINAIGEFWKNIVGDVLNLLVNQDLDAFKNSMSERWNELVGGAMAVWDGVMNLFGTSTEEVIGTVTSIFDTIQDAFAEIPMMIERLKNGFDNFISGISNSVDDVMGFFGLGNKGDEPEVVAQIESRRRPDRIYSAEELEMARSALRTVENAAAGLVAVVTGNNNSSSTVNNNTSLNAIPTMNPVNAQDPSFG